MADNREVLLAKGWRRHTFISTDNGGIDRLQSVLPEKLHEYLKTPEAKVLLATYDCAVVHDSFDIEPWVQILIAVPIEFEKGFAKGRDSRRIHFYVESEGRSLAYEINAKGICQIDRELLTVLDRDENCNLSSENTFDLKNWLSERFRQDTWPDSFNRAVSPASKRLKKFWKRYSDYISGLYIRLNTFDEITEGKYITSIIVCVESSKMRSFIAYLRDTDKSLEGKSLEEVKNKVVAEIKTVFGDCIEYEPDSTVPWGEAIDIIAEDVMSLTQLREFSRFSPYSLSLYESESALPVEMTPAKS